MNNDVRSYAGFWVRLLATLIDTAMILCVTFPLLIAVYGWAYFDMAQTRAVAGKADFLVTWVAPAVFAIAFWLYKQATPGKMAVGIKVVDAKTGNAMSFGQAIGRYLAYFISMIPLGLGFIWAAFDPRKQGWHDKLAGTVVVRVNKARP
jgi:uncharacterized RDD family membrane protein YckC